MKVSVVMPVFNTRPEYLRDAVLSIIGQDCPPHELIIVNDGSTREETLKELDEINTGFRFGLSDKIIRQKNKKISGALNTGICCMTGDWWAGCSSDDIWYPNKLKEQAKFITEHPEAKVVYCDWDFINGNGAVTRNYQEPAFKTREEAGRYIINNYFGMWSGLMIHRDVFDEIGFFNENYPTREDYEMNIRILTKYMMYRVPKTLCGYRVHSGQLTSTASKEMQEKYRIMARNIAIKHFGE